MNPKQFRALLAALLNSYSGSKEANVNPRQTIDEAFIEADIWIEAEKKKKPKKTK